MKPDTRHHVHTLVDQLPPVQLAGLEGLLQSMLEPVSRKLALAPIDHCLQQKSEAVRFLRAVFRQIIDIGAMKPLQFCSHY